MTNRYSYSDPRPFDQQAWDHMGEGMRRDVLNRDWHQARFEHGQRGFKVPPLPKQTVMGFLRLVWEYKSLPPLWMWKPVWFRRIALVPYVIIGVVISLPMIICKNIIVTAFNILTLMWELLVTIVVDNVIFGIGRNTILWAVDSWRGMRPGSTVTYTDLRLQLKDNAEWKKSVGA